MSIVRLVITFFFSLLSAQALSSENSCLKNSNGLVAKLNCLEGVEVVKESVSSDGLKLIELHFTQPMNHDDFDAKKFKQRVVLHHRSFQEPMLLQTSGYLIFSVRLAHIARYFNLNQIQVEHRYFSSSIPSDPDWSYLNIRQSAHDFHAITLAFKKLYPKPWINNGASKGGMTSIYHKYFFPDDLAGTVADVAPLSFSTQDKRYNRFLENVGGKDLKYCREKLKRMQIRLLKNRYVLLPQISGDFYRLGGAEVAFEHSIIEAPFVFWQYGKTSSCDLVSAEGDINTIFNFFQTFSRVSGYEDSGIDQFSPYYFQSATELGGPGAITKHLDHLIYFDFSLSQYTPRGVATPYSSTSMLEVRDWAMKTAENIIYVYGEFDPWSAGEFPLSNTGKNTHKFVVSKGNHSANFTKLDAKQKNKAVSIMESWLKKELPSQTEKQLKHGSSLEDDEFEMRKKLRL